MEIIVRVWGSARQDGWSSTDVEIHDHVADGDDIALAARLREIREAVRTAL
jgi:hypothetical protein